MMKSITPFYNPLSEIEKERKNKRSNSRSEIEKERLKRGVLKYKTQRQKRDEEDRRLADASASDSTTTDQESSGMSKGEKLLKIYETMGGDPFSFFKAPPAPVFQSRDLIGEIKEKNESLRRSGAAQKMFPMYYEKMGAKQGKFVKTKCKLGKNKKTRIY
jgi:hypothetical protein